MYTDDGIKHLTKYVDIMKLPTFLGGKNTKPLNDFSDPWGLFLE